jgi:23S rRNA (cytidine2498-2'-O)-methyltransferase
MHLLLWAEDSENELRSEFALSFPGAPIPSPNSPWMEAEFDIPAGERMPCLAFARQVLLAAKPVAAESIRGWAGELLKAVTGLLPEERPWTLHIVPYYGVPAIRRVGARAWYGRKLGHSVPSMDQDPRNSPLRSSPSAAAGQHRCRLIRDAFLELMQAKRRHLLRQLRREPAPFTPDDSLVQLLLTSPDSGFVSVAQAPLPFEQNHMLSPFPLGQVAVASDKGAPSRAFAKLVEAELRLGRAIRPGEMCVDLGAAPGSWTYVAAGRGAKVIAVDRSVLRDDLRKNRLVRFHPGDAFRFQPEQSVDWLLCDVIAEPERSADLLLNWLRHGWCRQFVVTIKLKDSSGFTVVSKLKWDLPPLTRELFLTRLCANKKELCVFGCAKPAATPPG